MPIVAAIVLLQIACAAHCVRSGRSGPWIMVIVFFPVLGSLAYAVMEVLPDMYAWAAWTPAEMRAEQGQAGG